jgi:hypothetical protein
LPYAYGAAECLLQECLAMLEEMARRETGDVKREA